MSIEQDKINQLDSDHRALLVEKNRLQSELEQARNERNVAQSELAVCCEDRDARALERDQVQQSLNRVEAGLRQQHELAQRLESERDELTEYVKRDAGRILQLEAECAAMRDMITNFVSAMKDPLKWSLSVCASAVLSFDNILKYTCGQGWVSPEAHAALLARMKNLEQLNVDACDDDTKIRNLCRPLLGEKLADHDGYAVVMIVDVVKNTIAQLREHARHALRLARDCHGGSEEFNALESRINK